MESLHPLVVHFPIALLTTAAILDVLGVLLRREVWHRIALWNLTLGTLSAGIAVITGLQAERVAKHSFEIWEVMERHEHLGVILLIAGLGMTAGRWAVRHRFTGVVRVAAIGLMIVLAVLVGIQAHLGGRLVFEFGVGGSFGAPVHP